MNKEILVTKRDGHKEPLNLEKLHRVTQWACEGLEASPSELELRANLQFFNNIKTSEVQETLVKSAADLITENTPDYQYVGGRLINYQLRKDIYGSYQIPPLFEHIQRVVKAGFYTPEILEWYSEAEIASLEKQIDHERDYLLTYCAMEQMRGKYLVRNRVTNQFYETPQMLFMLIAMTIFHSYKKDRLKWVRDFYDAISTFDLSLPTPIMAGVRTNQKQFSSCVLIETDDSLDSINATASAIVKYVAQKAGIGIGAGSIRALGSPVRNGEVYSTGAIPFFKYLNAAVKSVSQGGVRAAAATLYFPCWRIDVEDLLVLKNNKGTEDNRIRTMDYGVQFSKLFYERLINNENITLFSPSDVPGLYDSFFSDQDEFRRLYEKAEHDKKIRKKVIKAIDLFSLFVQERKDTGRIYLMNVDNVNLHSPYIDHLAAIHQSNLCTEVLGITKPLKQIDDPDGEIMTCVLSAINWGKIKKPSDFQRPCTLAVRALNEIIDYQEYPVLAAKNGALNRRPIGVGIINFAYWLAKNGMNYTSPDLEKVDEYAEAWSYYLIKASVDLAKETGPLPWLEQIKYSKGIVPADTRKLDVDELVPYQERMDWTQLREDLKLYGIKNSSTAALMPSETSSQITNSTNGIEPPRALVSVKASKEGVLKQVVPEIKKLANKYELLWDQESPEGYLKIMAILQKWIDQSISVNISYNPKFYPEEKIPLSEMLKHILLFYKWGGKCLYYSNVLDNSGEITVKEEEESCESCKL